MGNNEELNYLGKPTGREILTSKLEKLIHIYNAHVEEDKEVLEATKILVQVKKIEPIKKKLWGQLT